MAHGSKKVVIAALVGNGAITVMKFVAATISGSAAMLAETFHSAADTANQVMLLIGMKRSKKPADEAHPFGYGKEIYFWAFVVSVSIFVLGGSFSVFEGVKKLFHPHEMGSIVVPMVVLALAIVFEGYVFMVALKEARKVSGGSSPAHFLKMAVTTKDPTIMVVLFEDSAALSGLLVAFIAIPVAYYTGFHALDAVASIVIGLILFYVAFFLARETKALLIGESATTEDKEKIMTVLGGIAEIDAVGTVMTMHMGPEYILVNIEVDFADRLDATGVEKVVDTIEKRVKEAVPAVKKIFIEAEKLMSRLPEGGSDKGGGAEKGSN